MKNTIKENLKLITENKNHFKRGLNLKPIASLAFRAE